MYGFTKEALKEALLNLVADPSLMVDITHEHERMGIPEFRLRYMRTAGGMQFCLKSVSIRGESGGAYLPLESIDSFIEMVDASMKRKLESSARWRERAQSAPQDSVLKKVLAQSTDTYHLITREEQTQFAPNAHLHKPMPGEVTINLAL